jgi:hypothetical protein
VTYNGANLTAGLQAGSWALGGTSIFMFLNTANLFPVPIVRVLLQFDTGFIRTLIPSFDLAQ